MRPRASIAALAAGAAFALLPRRARRPRRASSPPASRAGRGRSRSCSARRPGRPAPRARRRCAGTLPGAPAPAASRAHRAPGGAPGAVGRRQVVRDAAGTVLGTLLGVLLEGPAIFVVQRDDGGIYYYYGSGTLFPLFNPQFTTADCSGTAYIKPSASPAVQQGGDPRERGRAQPVRVSPDGHGVRPGACVEAHEHGAGRRRHPALRAERHAGRASRTACRTRAISSRSRACRRRPTGSGR